MPLNDLIKYTDVFVETGCYKGDGISMALKAGYSKIYSIELCDYHYNFCLDKFKQEDKVKLFKGDSAFILGDVIKSITEPITFWLDGHWMPNDKEGFCGLKQFPIIEELTHIQNHPIKNHTILIDDINEFRKNSWISSIEELIRKINPGYVIQFLDSSNKADILLAEIGS